MAEKSYEKLMKEIGNMTVLELADFVKALEDKFGVSAAMPVGAVAAPVEGAAPEQQEEKSEYKVTLQDIGAEKIKVIKALKASVSGLTLSDAKKAVEQAPTVIAEAVSKEDAEKMKKDLEEAGAKIELS